MPTAWQPSALPPTAELETRAVLKKLPAAHRALAELKGLVAAIPNESILLDTLPLQEAKDSSAIENIITTHDELFNAELHLGDSQAAKEVQRYAAALRLGTALVKQYGFLSTNHIAQIQEELKRDRGGYRRLPGTALKNQRGEVVYTPPQDPAVILDLMGNLEQYLNDDSLHDVDPLVKMAVLHFQFESIHPFYDGNGRTGRILNILYLVLKGLLDIPVLYLSRFITQHKADYYRHLQAVRDTGDWEPWLLYLLTGVEQTARESIQLITEMRSDAGDEGSAAPLQVLQPGPAQQPVPPPLHPHRIRATGTVREPAHGRQLPEQVHQGRRAGQAKARQLQLLRQPAPV